MPCLEITTAQLAKNKKAALGTELTEAFCTATGFDAEIFSVVFKEFGKENIYSNGRLGDASYCHLMLYSPRLKLSQKSAVVGGIYRAFQRLQLKELKPIVHIIEHPYDNVGVEGELLSEVYGELRDREFYYDIPKD